jgi:thiol-disulfide isomerase/thioredoxin
MSNFETRIAEERGGKKHGKHIKKIVIGKVYADWCGHCQALKPEWKKMKHRVHTKKGKRNVVFEEIEEKVIEPKLKELKQKYGVQVEANGYPTLFKIENGKLEYYTGGRESNQMSKWYLGGGDEGQNLLSELSRDVQGGTRRHRQSHHKYRGKYFNPNYKYTRRNRATKSYHNPPKNGSSGLFDFLFGK